MRVRSDIRVAGRGRDQAFRPHGIETVAQPVGAAYCASPSCFACRAASQKAEMMMSWSPFHLLVWANSRSNAFPVGGVTVPSGRVMSPVNIPVTLVTTVIQSPSPN